MLALALPLGLAQLGYTSVSFVDTAIAGRASSDAVAAIGLGSSLFFAVSVFGVGTAMGLEPLVAQALGSGQTALAVRITWQGLWAGTIVCVPLAALVLVVGAQLTSFGIAPPLAALTFDYLSIKVLTLWPVVASVVLRSYLQAARRPGPIIVSVVALNLVNAVGDYLLLFGDAGLARLGLPGLGLSPLGPRGVAWSNTAAFAVQLVVYLSILHRPLARGQERGAWRPDWTILAQVFSVGVPFGLQLVAEIGVFSLAGLLIGRMGVQAMAAHQIAMQLATVTWAVAVGIGSATAVQVGRAIGRADAGATRRAGLGGLRLGAAWMLAMALVFAVWPEALAGLMTSDALLLPLVAQLVTIAAFFQLADGLQAVGCGALRGAGATRWTMVANLAGHWAVGLPLGLALLAAFGSGPDRLWWGLTAGLATVGVAVSWKFWHYSRQPIAQVLSATGSEESRD